MPDLVLGYGCLPALKAKFVLGWAACYLIGLKMAFFLIGLKRLQ